MPKRSWNDEIRRAIEDSGLPLYRLAKQANLAIGPTQRFMAGTHGMTIRTAERLAPFIGIELRRVEPKPGK